MFIVSYDMYNSLNDIYINPYLNKEINSTTHTIYIRLETLVNNATVYIASMDVKPIVVKYFVDQGNIQPCTLNFKKNSNSTKYLDTDIDLQSITSNVVIDLPNNNKIKDNEYMYTVLNGSVDTAVGIVSITFTITK